VGNDISGFADPDYLPVAARAGASVVATHIRLRPRVADPEPTYPRGVRAEVRDFLLERARQAMALGIARERVIIDAGLDLGKTWQQSLVLLRASSELADTGFALLLSASNKTFLGKLLDQEIDQRRESSLSATALGIAGGCRLIRAHDVAGTRRVVLVMEAILQARTERGLPLWRSHNEASSAVPEQPEQSEQPEQPGQPGQPEQPERSERSEQSEQSERVG